MDNSKIILEIMMDEIGLVGGGAAIGSGLGAASGAVKWAKDRMDLRGQMKSCGDNPACRESIKDKISQLNKRSLTGTVKRAAVGAGAGAAVGGLGQASGLSGVATQAKNAMATAKAGGAGIQSQLSAAGKEIAPAVQNAPKTLLNNINSTYNKAAQTASKYLPQKPVTPPTTV